MKRSKKFRKIKWALRHARGQEKKRLGSLFEKLLKLSTLFWFSSHKEEKRTVSERTAELIELDIIPGTKTTSTNYCDANGFLYTRNRIKNNNIYLVCKNSVGCDCSARAIIRNNDLKQAELVMGHSHHSSKKEVDKIMFRRTLQRICERNPTLSPLSCYIKAKKKLKDKVNRKNIPMISSFYSLMYRSQKKKVPLLPKSVEQFESLIAEAKNHKRYAFDDAGKLFYRGIWDGKTGQNVAFVSERTLQRVSEEPKVTLLMDGTFRVIPRNLGFRQVYIINVIINGRCFPLAYILMQRKDYHSYMTVFTELKKLLPSMNVVECMSDYELATRNAILQQFPGVRLSGCYFHYVQAIVKKCSQFGLLKSEDADKFQSAVNKVAVLALLPNNLVMNGFDYISKSVPKSRRWNKFEKYFHNQWKNANISVYGLAHRTNNFCETLNRNINKLVGQKGPHIWKLILTLQSVEMLKSDELEQIDGLLPNTRPSKKTVLFNEKVTKATEVFDKTGNFEQFIDFMAFNDDLAKAFNVHISDLDHLDEVEEQSAIIPNQYNELTEFRIAHPRKGAVKRKQSSESLSISNKKQK